MRPVLEDWTGHDLVESSLYGIRIYKENSVLATRKITFTSLHYSIFKFSSGLTYHVADIDRLPLVSSAIIQVDQVLNEVS